MQKYDHVSPCGIVRLLADGGKLCRVELLDLGAESVAAPPRRGARQERPGADSNGWRRPYARLLDGYFQGGKDPGEGSRCLARSRELTPFQRRVYEKLAEVGFGCVVTYGELALLCGERRSARAVGRALSTNRFPIFIPCHRVVAAGGGLGGFSAGVEWKRRLLDHEGWLMRPDGKGIQGRPDNQGLRRGFARRGKNAPASPMVCAPS